MSCWIDGCVSARVTLALMTFSMFLVTQMVKSNLNIVMVAIEEEMKQTNSSKINWDENASGIVLGAFFWSYWITELPGGLLAQKYGGKNVLAIGVLASGIINMILPIAFNWYYPFCAFLRALQGLALGVTWPAIHWLSARWIPSTERSKFMVCFHGTAIGICITNPLGGFLISRWGWQWVFYTTGFITILWSLFWYFLVFDSPSLHPRISVREKEYLLQSMDSLASTKKGKLLKTPWLEILKSGPFWGVLFASQGLMWGTITLSMQTPLYFRSLHKLNFIEVGYFSGLPEIFKFIFSLIFSIIVDKCLTAKYCSLTVARKIAVAISEYIPAIFLLLVGLLCKNNPNLAFYFLILTLAAGGASSSGSLANIVDLSPNHAGTLLGIIKTLLIVPGVISPMISSYLVNKPGDLSTNWEHLYWTLAIVYIVCSTIFLVLGSGKVQKWNEIGVNTNSEDIEKEPLRAA